MRLADRLGVDRATASKTYDACLLSHSGCTTDALTIVACTQAAARLAARRGPAACSPPA